jgi:hypothetical protein
MREHLVWASFLERWHLDCSPLPPLYFTILGHGDPGSELSKLLDTKRYVGPLRCLLPLLFERVLIVGRPVIGGNIILDKT